MKIAILTDTHAGARNDNPIFNQFFLLFYEQIFFPYLKENNIKRVLHLGDVFDRRKYINFNTLNSWQTRVFKPLEEIVDRVDVLVGNHDTYYKNTNMVNSVKEILSGYAKYNIYDKPTEVDLCGLKSLYIPWVCEDTERITDDMITKTDAKVCFGHLDIIGFELFAGHTNVDKGYHSSKFDKFYMTISGHYHHPSNKGSIYFLGAPYPIIWTDWGEPRGFHVFDTETLELTFVENPYQIFNKIYYNDTVETYESLMEKDYSNIQGMFVKVIVQKKSNPYWFDQFIEGLQKYNPCDITVVEASLDDGNSSDESLDEAKDTLTILMEYVDGLEIQNNKTELQEYLRELYIEALNSTDQTQGS